MLPPSALAAQRAQSSQPAPLERLSFPWHPGQQTHGTGSRAYVCSLSKQVGKKKKPRGAFSRRPSASTTPPRVPSTQFIFLPIKASPPAWLWETQFMRRALGVLLLAGTEQGSQRGGGPGSRTSRSLVSRRQRRAGTGSPRADRKSGAPPPRPRPPRGRHGPWVARGLQPRRADRGNGADPGLDPQAEQWHLLHILG